MSERGLNAQLSKWRQQSVEVKAGELKEVYFGNTNPNMFFISNFNDVDIYGGLNRIPTAKSHEFIFKAHKQKPFGVPLGKRVMYLLNLSQEDITLDVYSTEMAFDLNVLHDFTVDNVMITADDPISMELKDINEGFVMPVSNDTETKNLLVSVTTAINAVKENQLTKVEMNTLKTYVENIYKDIRNWFEEKSTRKNDPVYLNGVNAFEYEAYSRESVHFDWLFNDGSDITFTRNNEEIFTVKAGEQLRDFDIELKNGDILKIVGDAVNVRIKYWYFVY